MADKKVELLEQVPLFSECSKKELQRIASLVDEIDVDAGTELTTEGRPGREFFVIADGQATVSLRGEELAELGAGGFFGEMALLDHEPRAATVKAKTPLRLYVLDPLSFAALLDDAPSVSKKMMRGMAKRLREIEDAPSH